MYWASGSNIHPEAFSLLAERGSLTERFRQIMGEKPHLTRLNQGRQLVSSAERQLLDIKPRQMAMVREIKMGNAEQAWLFARTVIPIQTLSGSAKRICGLDNTPIGKILFGRMGAKRKAMNVGLVSEFPSTLMGMNIALEHRLWERRSIFEFTTGPLMVTEIFLPHCPIYALNSSHDGSSKYEKHSHAA